MGPPSWPVDCPSSYGQAPAPVPIIPWGHLPNVNCYTDQYPFDHGAEVNLNGGESIAVNDADECEQKCQLDAYYPQGDGFAGCEYAVYSAGQCWPRKGLQCSKCDGGSSASGFTLLVPPSWPVDCPSSAPSGPAPAPVPTTPWGQLPNVNCYTDQYPYDHGAEVNLNGGEPIAVNDADECWQKCQLDAYYPQGDDFTDCEYAVYSTGQCWPRKGLQCSKCDGGSSASGFTLLIPPSWPVDCPLV